jgi:hypothetical protein
MEVRKGESNLPSADGGGRSQPAECVNPSAPIVSCAKCGKPVHTCERVEPANNDYRCPAHPDGVQFEDDRWACSQECYDLLMEAYLRAPQPGVPGGRPPSKRSRDDRLE